MKLVGAEEAQVEREDRLERAQDYNAEFDSEYYMRRYPDADAGTRSPLDHFLTTGIYEGRSPNKQFEDSASISAELSEDQRTILGKFVDPSFYLTHYVDVRRAGVDPVDHFLEWGIREGRIPNRTAHSLIVGAPSSERAALYSKIVADLQSLVTPQRALKSLVDNHYYASANPDVRRSRVSPDYHFLTAGIDEGRIPNPWFDADWYSAANGLSDKERMSFIHYLMHGLGANSFPLAELGITAARIGHHQFDLDQFIALANAISKHQGMPTISTALLKVFCRAFDPVYYLWRRNIDPYSNIVDVICDYLNDGIHEGHLISQAFNHEHYIKRANISRGPSKASNVWIALEHWRTVGRQKKISTSPKFDPEWYLHTNKDLDPKIVDAYEHFVFHGIFEGRLINRFPRIPISVRPSKAQDYRVLPLYIGPSDVDGIIEPKIVERCSRIAVSRPISEMIKSAQLIEPSIQGMRESKEFLIPPWHAAYSHAVRDAHRRLSKLKYDYIVCVPWIRMGGADLIASVLSKTLRNSAPTSSILVIQTDSPLADRQSWFGDLEILDLSDITVSNLGSLSVEYVFASLLRRLKPKAVFNVNSKLAFDVFVRYGDRLTETMKTYSYYFCWDQTPEGRPAGYPSDYFPLIAGRTTGSITDSEHLRRELISIYRLPANIQSKVHVLKTPVHSAAVTLFNAMVRKGGERPLFFWAGRFDRQKRFDLLCRIADAMPDVDFWVWGSHVMDVGSKLPRYPLNVTVHSPFRSLAEVPFAKATGWLYTSAWDGLPTLLIELGARGIPIVASNVGGVGELIDNATGWPIDQESTPDAYVRAILEIVDNPTLASQRGAALHRRVMERHSTARYSAAVQGILNDGAGNIGHLNLSS